MGYQIGDKFIIEIDSKMTRAGDRLYGIKGFHSLVFDEAGLERLEKCEEQGEKRAMIDGAILLKQKLMRDYEKIVDELIKEMK